MLSYKKKVLILQIECQSCLMEENIQHIAKFAAIAKSLSYYIERRIALVT